MKSEKEKIVEKLEEVRRRIKELDDDLLPAALQNYKNAVSTKQLAKYRNTFRDEWVRLGNERAELVKTKGQLKGLLEKENEKDDCLKLLQDLTDNCHSNDIHLQEYISRTFDALDNAESLKDFQKIKTDLNPEDKNRS